MMRCMRPLLGFVVIGVLLRLASPAHALNIGNPRLVRALTQTDSGVERENNALVLYRGAGFDGVLRDTLDRLYLIPVCPTGLVQDTNKGHQCVGADWVWQINDFNQPVGVEYVSFPGSQTTQPGVRYQLQ